jgi:hypothetical protein
MTGSFEAPLTGCGHTAGVMVGALPPRKITWQSGVAMGLHHRDLAILCTDRKWCHAAAWMASVAMRMLPSVPFLKPMGAEMPDQFAVHLAFDRARAPIAPKSGRRCTAVKSRPGIRCQRAGRG